jgi:hypothetical protein
MAATSTPYGAQVIGDEGGVGRTERLPFGIVSGYAANIFKYQPIKIDPTTGTIQAVTNPGGTPDAIFGIFAGCEFTPQGGRPAESPFWPSGTVYNTVENMFVYYWPLWTPSKRILVQADGSVPSSLLGSQFNFNNLTAGNTSVGLSQCTVAHGGVQAGSQGQLVLVEFAPLSGDPDNGGDAYTDLICTIAYPQIGFRGQNSIG